MESHLCLVFKACSSKTGQWAIDMSNKMYLRWVLTTTDRLIVFPKSTVHLWRTYLQSLSPPSYCQQDHPSFIVRYPNPVLGMPQSTTKWVRESDWPLVLCTPQPKGSQLFETFHFWGFNRQWDCCGLNTENPLYVLTNWSIVMVDSRLYILGFRWDCKCSPQVRKYIMLERNLDM